MITIDDTITKMTTPITLKEDIGVIQRTLLKACGATEQAAAKRALHILETSPIRQFIGKLYPAVNMTEEELVASPDIVTIHKSLLPYKDYIKYGVPSLTGIIPKETVKLLQELLVVTDPQIFIAVTTFTVLVAALKQTGSL